MYYDIHNISKDRWESSVVVHLGGDIASGFKSVCIKVGGVIENVPEDQVTEQMKRLAKKKRQRPPIIELREVDYEARMLEKEKQLELIRARGEKKLAALSADEEAASEKEDKKSSRKSKKSGRNKELSEDEKKALEAGTDLPSS